MSTLGPIRQGAPAAAAASSSSSARNVVVLYCVQGDRGDDPAHPNAFQVARPAAGVEALRLRDIAAAFPLRGRGLFHFRARRPSRAGGGFLDLRHPDDRVPVADGGDVVMRVLRLENLKCASAVASPLRPRSRAAAAAAPDAAAAAVQPQAAAGAGALPRSPAPTLKARGRQPSLDDMNVKPRGAGGGGAEGSARGRSGSGSGGGGGDGGGTRAHSVGPLVRSNSILDIDDDDAPPASTAVPAAAAAQGGGGAADEDLAGKSEFVRASVMARRAAARKKEDAAVKSVDERERARAAEADAAADAGGRLLPRLRAWEEESGIPRCARARWGPRQWAHTQQRKQDHPRAARDDAHGAVGGQWLGGGAARGADHPKACARNVPPRVRAAAPGQGEGRGRGPAVRARARALGWVCV